MAFLPTLNFRFKSSAPTTKSIAGLLPAPADAPPARLVMPFIPGLDGLRALAVGAVLLYHADLTFFKGGFLGVEVFFVISGYLITSLLLGEWRTTGRINLKMFWLRRARRLLPALFVLLLAVLTFAVIALPDEVASLRSDALAAFGYVTNWYLVLAHKSYFENIGRPSLLRHLWSLAVEEQFYLIWPPLLLLALKKLRPGLILTLILGGAALSALAMAIFYQPEVDPSRLYYGTDTRAAGLLLGAALAFGWPPGRQVDWHGPQSVRRAWLLNGLGGAALTGLFACFALIGEFDSFLYQGGFVLVSLLTLTVIWTVVHPLTHLGGWLNWLPLRWIGLRSYSLYLWHWPVYMVTRPQQDTALDGLPLLIVRVGLAIGLADLSYHYVEMPIRNGALGRLWQSWKNGTNKGWAIQTGRIGAGLISLTLLAVLSVEVVGAKLPPTPDYILAGEQAIATPAPRPATSTPEPTATPLPTAVILPDATATPEATATPLPTATPKPTVPPDEADLVPGRISAIGDSVMLSAAGELKKDVPNISINAKVSRYFPDGPTVVKQLREAGELGDVVVIHLGTNWNFTAKQFDDLMGTLKGVKKVVFVNLKMPRSWEEPNNEVLANGVGRYPNASLIDWHKASVGQPGYFWDDGIHLRPDGQKAYANLIAAYAK